MTREEDYTISDKWWQEHAEKFHVDCLQVEDIVDRAFWAGAEWADAHPHWISVEDELPPCNVFVLTCDGQENTNLLMLGGNGRWYDKAVGLHRNITHWMPLPSVEHLKKGGKK